MRTAFTAMFIFTVYLGTLLVTSVLSAKPKSTDCPPYPHVILDHGTIHRIGHQKYSFRCDKGYFLASSNTVRCYRGNWTNTNEPKCLRKQGQCDEPPAVANAKVYGEERNVGDRVKYICNEGFTLLGHSELACSRNGHWDRRPPTCMDESEPLQDVAERLKNSFVTELASHSPDTPEGRLLDKSSLLLGLELFLLIDRSSSIDPVHLEYAKRFVKFLLKRFEVNNGADNEKGTRAAVFAFGTEVEVVFDIDDAKIINHRSAAAVVDTIQPNGGGTNIEEALTKVALDTFKLRPEAKRAVFLMTDGEPNIANPEITPQDIALKLRNTHKFEIFAVGIGKGIRITTLNELASEPPLSHVFVLEDYPDLNDVMEIIEDSKPLPPPISKEQCGYNATMEGRPWEATLYVGGGSSFKICSGVLICRQWVLTAASCLQNGQEHVHKKDVFVVLGERHLLKPERNQKNFYVVDMRLHLNYDSRHALENNLALLKLNLEASMYRPACLPPTDRAVPLHLNLKINASIAGWGTTSGARMVHARADEINIIDSMNTTSVSLSEEQECPIRRRGESSLCAGQGSRTCFGMVGSPLMAEDPSTGFQHALGILVDRRHCAKGQNQYLELTKYIGWINHVTSGCHLKHWDLAK